MKRFRMIALLLLGSVAVQAPAQTLENAGMRLEVSSENGSLTSLVDKRTGVDLITGEHVRLFQLLLAPIGERTRNIRSWNQRGARITSSPEQLEIRFERLQPDEEQYIFGSGYMRFPEPQLDIAATITLRLDGEHILAGIDIDNRSNEVVTGVIFPFIGGMPLEPAADQGDASVVSGQGPQIVLPSLGQRVFGQTGGAFSGERTSRYPAVLATTWVNYQLDGRSLGIEARTSLQTQDALFALSPGHFQEGSAYQGRYEYPLLGWISHPHIAVQSQWASPEMLIHVHDGDWHAMAAEHREWFRAKNRPETSQRWSNRIGFATYRLKRDDNTIDWRYENLPALAKAAATAGIRDLVIEGWRETEGLRNPAPRGEIADPRLGGGTELAKVIAELARSGTQLAFAFHPTLINVFADQYPSPDAAWAVKTSRQANQIQVDFLASTIDHPANMLGTQYRMEIDPASAATDFLLAEAQRLRNEYGMGGLFLKGIGQRSFLSHNRYHGVAPQDVYRAGYAKLLGGLREIYPDGLLLNEGFNDLVNPFADGGYTWDQTHDPAILAYSIPWSNLSNDVEALDYGAANLSFAHKALINLIVDAGRGTVAGYPGFARHLADLQELKATTSPYYAAAEFRDQEGIAEIESPPETLLTVFTNDEARKAGVVIANLGAQAASVSFELELPEMSSALTLFRLNGERSALDPGAGKISVELQPYEIAILGIDR